jgi:hypothetical protein
MRSRVRLLALLVASLALVVATRVQAAPPKPSGLDLMPMPVLGPGSPLPEGWSSYVVWLHNGGASELSGTVRLEAKTTFARELSRGLSTAPFTLAPGARAKLELPTHGYASSPAELELHAVAADGVLLAAATVPEPRPNDPLLVDLSTPSRVASGVRGAGLLLVNRGGGGLRESSALVTTPPTDPSSGDLTLPRWPAVWSPASLVVTSGRRLATLGKPELRALTDWVLAGGALGVALERPEDARFPALAALVGGSIERTTPSPELLAPALFYQPGDTSGGAGPRGAHLPIVATRLAPSAETAPLLEGFSGGNLRPSPWGAVASYGLGEVHLLAFDLGEPFAADRWVTLKLADLLRHSFERRLAVALPLGRTGFDGPGANAIRAELDPNRSMRWTIVVSALILLVYAALAGPLSFWLASRKGKPLRALVHLPLWAAATLGLVVTIGLLGKGIRGRARHLTLIESGAGMERAPATRFRGFYASSTREMSVQPSARSSLIEVATGDDFVDRTLVVDRDGAHLERMRTKPWATVVVRDDGFASLAGGISVVQGATGEVTVHNRTAHDLVAVVLHLPGTGFVLFPRIADGKSVKASEGKPLAKTLGLPSPVGAHPLGATDLAASVDAHAEGLGAALAALEAQANEADWWPSDVPVLLAQIVGGEGKLTDSGMRLDRDRVIVRVVGLGGVP